MRGELLSVWGDTWSEVFVKLYDRKVAPEELFLEIYETLIPKPLPPTEPILVGTIDTDGNLCDPNDITARDAYELALEKYNHQRQRYDRALTDPAKAREWLREDILHYITTESAAVAALEKVFLKVADIGGDELSNEYFIIVESFLTKYSLRYDLRRQFSLHPTVPGIFTRLFSELKGAAIADITLNAAMQDFEEAIRDLKNDQSPNRIKTCIAKQTNLLEAIGQRLPLVKSKTLGMICDQAGTWPHDEVKESMKSLYKFASDYPGIRHGGTPASQIREIEMRDLVALSALLVGFAPYLTDQLNSNSIYDGGL
jgi:hypothetical protein